MGFDSAKTNPDRTDYERYKKGNEMNSDENRIVYDSTGGKWKVKFNNKLIAKDFKTSGEAFQYLTDLKTGKVKPE